MRCARTRSSTTAMAPLATVWVAGSGTALGLAWSDAGSLREALSTARGVYRSRSRGRWREGERSGAIQEPLLVEAGCGSDALPLSCLHRNGDRAGAGECSGSGSDRRALDEASSPIGSKRVELYVGRARELVAERAGRRHQGATNLGAGARA